MLHFILHVLGIDTQQSYFYDFWSGVATQMSALAAVIVYYKKHNCHVHGCPRIGKHPVGHYVVCAKHHPYMPRKITTEHIQFAHEKSKEQ